MDFWITFWAIVFAMTLLVYTGLVLVVTFGGWKDMRAMFHTLDVQHQEEEEI